MSGRRCRLALLLAALAAAGLLGACGKKGAPIRPGETGYPHAYPAPSSVAPAGPTVPEDVEVERATTVAPGPFPYSRSRTRRYGLR